jgi:phage gpG-like protein
MEALLGQLRTLGAAADDIMEEVKFDLAFDTQAFAIQGIQRSGGGGRTYEKYKPRRTHTASAPGAYPATDTGRLASSVAAILPTSADMTGQVGTHVKYGAYLEFGTSRMAARPWLLPSFNRAKIGVEKELKRRWEAMV